MHIIRKNTLLLCPSSSNVPSLAMPVLAAMALTETSSQATQRPRGICPFWHRFALSRPLKRSMADDVNAVAPHVVTVSGYNKHNEVFGFPPIRSRTPWLPSPWSFLDTLHIMSVQLGPKGPLAPVAEMDFMLVFAQLIIPRLTLTPPGSSRSWLQSPSTAQPARPPRPRPPARA